MIVAIEHRERLAHYCRVRKMTQEDAVNEMVAEGLRRVEEDPAMKKRLDRARELQAELDAL
jgi:hypothetical protein